jgi:hypothetical protein
MNLTAQEKLVDHFLLRGYEPLAFQLRRKVRDRD